MNDILYTVNENITNPFSESIFAIVKEEQEEQRIPLFYNDNNQWVIRYSSSRIGKKKY